MAKFHLCTLLISFIILMAATAPLVSQSLYAIHHRKIPLNPETQNSSLPTEPSVRDILRGLALHPDGFVQLSADGVFRSYHPNASVLDCARLSTAQLIMVHKQPTTVNGLDVSDEECMNPPLHLMPQQFQTSTLANSTGNTGNETWGPALRERVGGPAVWGPGQYNVPEGPMEDRIWNQCHYVKCTVNKHCTRRPKADCVICLMLVQAHMERRCNDI